MNLPIIYFSQTGNTRKVAEAIATVFREIGHTVRTIPLKKTVPQDTVTGDWPGIGAPCFSSQAPTPVKEFLQALPALDERRAFVFATSGRASGRVLYDLTRGLQGKGESHRGVLDPRRVASPCAVSAWTDAQPPQRGRFGRHAPLRGRHLRTHSERPVWPGTAQPSRYLQAQRLVLQLGRMVRCYRCVTGCPQKAYTVDWRWGNRVT